MPTCWPPNIVCLARMSLCFGLFLSMMGLFVYFISAALNSRTDLHFVGAIVLGHGTAFVLLAVLIFTHRRIVAHRETRALSRVREEMWRHTVEWYGHRPQCAFFHAKGRSPRSPPDSPSSSNPAIGGGATSLATTITEETLVSLA